MSADAVIAEGLGKTYHVYATPLDRLREAVSRRPRHRDFAALADVSFTVAKGEGIGIIGENGAGKSTLLKMLAGITAPTAGRVAVAGKVASILELGSAFHPELTGRQNVVLNAAMLGLSERELQRKMPAIEAFSELGPFLDQPVKAYSTGMAMRLGFSIATQVEPDVLIVDEALSVGDGYFQKKCIDRLLAFLAGGGTLLFCSHAMYYVTAFCRRALWLKQGRVAALGEANAVVRRYEDYLLEKSAPDAAAAPAAVAEEALPGAARITAVRLGGSETLPRLVHCDDPLNLEVEWESEEPELGFHLAVGLNRLDEVEVAAFGTLQSGLPAARGGHRHHVRLRVPRLPIVKGQFTLYIFLLDAEGLHIYDRRALRAALAVEGPSYTVGLVRLEHSWEIDAPSRQPAAWAVARA
jgi:ABC-type polysaccharide/polyol phosphate transport system ATPase subunit